MISVTVTLDRNFSLNIHGMGAVNMTKDLSHIGDVLQGVIKTCRQNSDLEMTQIWDLWDAAVGKEIAENAQPQAFKGSFLLVHVSSSVWVQQLQFLKNDIIQKVNCALEKELVQEIRFKIGPL